MPTTTKPASDALSRLRDMPTARHRAFYKTYGKVFDNVRRNGYLDENQRRAEGAKVFEKAQAELVEMRNAAQSERTTLVQRASSRKVASTEESRAVIRQRLDSGKWTVSELAAQLAKDGDRAGMAALAEQIPYAIHEGKVPMPGGIGESSHPDVAEKYYLDILREVETPLLTEAEARERGELRESDISFGLLDHNQKELETWLTRQYNGTPAIAAMKPNLFRWQGLPNDTQPKGRLDPDGNDD